VELDEVADRVVGHFSAVFDRQPVATTTAPVAMR